MAEMMADETDRPQHPAIEPVPMAALDAEFAAGIERAMAARVLSASKPVQVWAHRPQLAKAWLGLLELFASDALLPERTRELVRLKIASVTNCRACRMARKSDTVSEEDIACLSHDDPRFSRAETVALDYAFNFAADYDAIGDAHFEALRQHYSEAEIVELNMYCAIMLAGGRMTYVQRAY